MGILFTIYQLVNDLLAYVYIYRLHLFNMYINLGSQGEFLMLITCTRGDVGLSITNFNKKLFEVNIMAYILMYPDLFNNSNFLRHESLLLKIKQVKTKQSRLLW